MINDKDSWLLFLGLLVHPAAIPEAGSRIIVSSKLYPLLPPLPSFYDYRHKNYLFLYKFFMCLGIVYKDTFLCTLRYLLPFTTDREQQAHDGLIMNGEVPLSNRTNHQR